MTVMDKNKNNTFKQKEGANGLRILFIDFIVLSIGVMLWSIGVLFLSMGFMVLSLSGYKKLSRGNKKRTLISLP